MSPSFNRSFALPFGRPFLKELCVFLKESVFNAWKWDPQKTIFFLPTQFAVSQCLNQLQNYAKEKEENFVVPEIFCLSDIVKPTLQIRLTGRPFFEEPPLTRLESLALILGQLPLSARNFDWGNSVLDLFDDLCEANLSVSDFLKIIDISSTEKEVLLQALALLEENEVGKHRYSQCLKILSSYWKETPPENPIVLAGITGQNALTSLLINTVCGLPKGITIFAGGYPLNPPLKPTHPLFKSSPEILLLPPQTPASPYEPYLPTLLEGKLINHSLSPTFIESSHLEEEAEHIAQLIRIHLEESPYLSIHLISPHALLKQRIYLYLKKWGIDINWFEGLPFFKSPLGNLLDLSAQLIDSFSIQQFLAFLKHSWIRPFYSSKELSQFEKQYLRQGFFLSFADLPSLPSALYPTLSTLFEKIGSRFQNGNDNPSLLNCVTRHKNFLDLFNVPAPIDVWSKTEKFARLLEGQQSYRQLIQKLFFETQRLSAPSPVLFSGPFETRFLVPEILIVCGLNEEHWLGTLPYEALLSLKERKQLNLPLEEDIIRRTAHDFCHCLSAQKLYFSRSITENGKPTVASRFWEKLQTVHNTIKKDLPYKNTLNPFELPDDSPNPALDQRPCRYSMTDFEALTKDPYGFYAKRILTLKPLNPLDHFQSALEFGKILHKVLYEALKEKGSFVMSSLLEQSKQWIVPLLLNHPNLQALWDRRLSNIFSWLIEQPQKEFRKLEAYGEASFDFFSLYGIADRIEYNGENQASIIDYKTGTPPTKTEIEQGKAPQIPLEMLIANENGFGGFLIPTQGEIWHLSGRKDQNKRIEFQMSPEELFDIREKITFFLKSYLKDNRPYLRPQDPSVFTSYHHLERIEKKL